MKGFFLLTILFAAAMAYASGTTTIDGDTISSADRTKAWTMPASTDTLLGRATTDTLTNKSISGSTNTFSAIPVSAIATGTALGVNAGGTGLTSGTSGGVLAFSASGTIVSSSALTQNAIVLGGGAGAAPSPLGSLGTATTLLHGNASGAPTFGAVSLTADVSGTLPVGNGGLGVANPTAGSVVVGNGSSAVSLVAPGSSGNVLTSNGSTWVSSASSSGSPSLNGGSASPQVVTAVGGVTLASIGYSGNFVWVAPASAVTVTATPSITACTADGQLLKVIGTSNSNTLTLQDQSSLASSGLSLNGNWVGSKDRVLNLHCDITQGLWVEDSRR